MVHYLFSNDQRISDLEGRIEWVAKYVESGKALKDIPDKSDNNNAATLEFYYNLYPETENTKVAVTSSKEVIRNFVLKFQYPNPRTQESLIKNLSEGVFLAPYRSVVSLLVSLIKIEQGTNSYLSLEEILYYIFANPSVCKNPKVDYDLIAYQVIKDRETNKELSEYISENIEWNQRDRQIREMMSVLVKCMDCFKLSKGILTFIPDAENKDFIKQIVENRLFWIPANKDNSDSSIKEYISYMNMAATPYNVVDFSKKENNNVKQPLGKFPLQQITYGAPGTGKSFGLKGLINSMDHFRTTFHPDSDYASFVGAYKPTMTTMQVKVNGQTKIDEEQITYKFVAQTFIKTYVSAWKNYKDEKPTVLVIEEINRGNCAQIFGDLFQLLDRDESGFSSYPIEADADVALYLNGAMKDVNLGEQASAIDELFADSYPNGITDKIKSGELLLLPNNLYIWATMNTSDQSLFPIDSAFKRRWDWKYIKISDAHKGWFIKCGSEGCDWWTFISMMNKRIAAETSSDDKKMGYFFCKPEKDESFISEEKFVNKVLFYLWNDVFKDGDTSVFNVSDNQEDEPTFEAFYNDDNTPNLDAIRNILVTVVGEGNIFELDNDDNEAKDYSVSNETEGDKVSRRDYTKYIVNDGKKIGKNKIACECLKEYIRLNPNLALEQVLDEWKSLDFDAPHFIESEEDFRLRQDKDAGSKSDKVPCNSGFIYVANNVYNKFNIVELINAINSKNWGIDIKKCD